MRARAIWNGWRARAQPVGRRVFDVHSSVGGCRAGAIPAIRYLGLARPLFPTLNQAVPYAQLNTLHNAVPAITGGGVVVGVIDDVLDLYHPDFRTPSNATRVVFLWDQNLTAQAGEAGASAGGLTYGVEYNQAAIDNELNSFDPQRFPPTRTSGMVAQLQPMAPTWPVSLQAMATVRPE